MSLTAKTTDDYGLHIIIALPKTINLSVVYIFHSMQLFVLFKTASSFLYPAHHISFITADDGIYGFNSSFIFSDQ